MAYWWVYQGKSFDRALKGGYMWAPHTTKTGGTPYYYWSNVRRVQMSDIVFSHREGQIVAVRRPEVRPTTHPRPIQTTTMTGLRKVGVWTLITPY
jgi:hypothetical protein